MRRPQSAGSDLGGQGSASTPLLSPRPSVASSLRESSVTFGGGGALAASAGNGAGGGSALGGGLVGSPSGGGGADGDEQARWLRRRMGENPMWSLDRGTGRNDADRVAFRKASLLSTGM
jgi:hypothetical protein